MSTVEDRLLVICLDDNGYTLFALDINGDSPDVFVDKRPTLRVKTLTPMCFCVLDSCLYMFHETESEFEYGKDETRALEMFKFDLSRDIWDTDVVFEPSRQKEEVQKMKSYKMHPDAIKTPDGKIMVFSRCIEYYKFESEVEHDNFDFEIFDPESGSWAQLPQLLILVPPFSNDLFSIRDPSGKWIECIDHSLYLDKKLCDPCWLTLGGCFFMNNTKTFVVRASFGGMFSLNLDALEEGWKQYEEKIHPRIDEFLLFEGLTLTPCTVERGTIQHILDIYRHPNNMGRPGLIILILDYIPTEKKCIACIVGTGIDDDTQHPYIVCDLFNIHLSLETPPAHVASFKFSVKEESSVFLIAKVLPIRGVWAGMIFGGTAIQTVVLCFVTSRTNWEVEVEKATSRVGEWSISDNDMESHRKIED